MKKSIIIFLGVFTLAIPKIYAIPPPDFFIAIFQAFLQFLGLLFAIFLGWLITFYRYFKEHKSKFAIFGVSLLVFVAIGFGGYYYFENQSKNNELVWREDIKGEITDSIYESIKYNDLLNQNNLVDNYSNQLNTQIYYDGITIFTADENNREVFRNNIWNEVNNYSIDYNQLNYLYSNDENIFIIDLREQIEFEAGYFKNSIHSRDVDFILGDYLKVLPDNKNVTIVLVCYSDLISSYFTLFVKELGYQNVYYLKSGIEKLDLKYSDLYVGSKSIELNYNFTSNFDISYLNSSYIGIDVRTPQKYYNAHFPNSIHFFRDGLTTSQIKSQILSFEKDKDYYIVCDGLRNCWSALNLVRDFKKINNLKIKIYFDLSNNIDVLGILNNYSSEIVYSSKNFDPNLIDYNSNKTDIEVFWERHKKVSLQNSENITFGVNTIYNHSIDQNQFVELRENTNMLILDLRDQVSFSRGSFDNAVHMKLSDFVNGGWQKIPLENYDTVFLLCYGGTSGYLTAEFLYNQGYSNVYFFKNGVFDIIDTSYVGYEGELGLQLPEDFKRFMTKKDFEKSKDNGSIILDVRPYEKFLNDKIDENAVYFFHEAMTTDVIENLYNQYPKGTKFITYCDSGLTCWVTGVVGLELEDRGFIYEGKYTKNLAVVNDYYEYNLISKGNYINVIESFN